MSASRRLAGRSVMAGFLTLLILAAQLVSSALLPASTLPAAGAATPPGVLRFNQTRYALPACSTITLFYSGSLTPALDVHSVATKDVVQRSMTKVAAGKYVSSSCISMIKGTKINDGVLQSQPGDVLMVRARANNTTLAIGAVTTAGVAAVPPGVNVELNPQPFPPGPLGPNARMEGPNGKAAFFAQNAVVLSNAAPGDLAGFLDRHQGTNLGSVSIPGTTGAARTYYTVKLDPSKFDDTGFAQMLKRAGTPNGTIKFSSANARKLMDLVITEQIAGMAVWPDLMYRSADIPSSDEGGGADQFAKEWFNPGKTDGSAAIRAGEATALLDVMKTNAKPKTEIAVIDGGFAGPSDFGGGFTPPDYGVANYNSIPQCDVSATGSFNCAPGSTQGKTNTPCQGGVSCPWHGLEMASAAAGRFNNGAGGAAGSGGQTAKLRFFKLAFVYTIPLAAAIKAGASSPIESISSGAPCVLLLDLCDGGVRAFLTGICVASLGLDPISCGALGVAATFDAIENAVKFAIASNTVIFAAAGNNTNEDPSKVKQFPCVLASVVCVGGLAPSGLPAPTRNMNLTKGTRIDIWAPSASVVVMPDPSSGGNPTSIDGTSPATAFMAGVASIALTLDPALTGAQVRALIHNTGCKSGNTARIVGPACTPSTDPDVNGGNPNNAGYVDVLEVVRRARQLAGNPSLGICTGGFDELNPPSGDTPSTPQLILGSVPAAKSGILVQKTDLDRSITRLDTEAASDTAYYRFDLTGSIPLVKAINVEAAVTVPDPSLGVLKLAYWQVGTGGIGPPKMTSVPLSIDQDSSGGTARILAPLVIGKRYMLQVLAKNDATIDRNCYDSITLTAKEEAPDPPPHEPWLEAGNASVSPAIRSSAVDPPTMVAVPVTLTGTLPFPVQVDATFTDVTALAGSDYDGTAQSVVIPSGQTMAVFHVPVFGQPSRSAYFSYTITSSQAPVQQPTGYVSIMAPPTPGANAQVQIGDVDVYEGDTGGAVAYITVTSDNIVPLSTPITVNFTSVDGSKTAPADYAPVSGSIVIPADTFGGNSADITIAITTDTLPEFDGSFTIQLTGISGGDGAVLGAKTVGTVTIVDDDPRP